MLDAGTDECHFCESKCPIVVKFDDAAAGVVQSDEGASERDIAGSVCSIAVPLAFSVTTA